MSPRTSILGACLLELLLSVALVRQAGAADVVVKRFVGGSSQDAVGIVEASVDTEIYGPQALTTDEKGDIYLLDQVNGRIVRFNPKSPAGESRLLAFPDQLQPTDLIVRKSDILVWDGSVHALQAPKSNDDTSFRGLEEVSTRAADDETVVSAFAQMGSLHPGDATELLDANTRAAARLKSQPRPRQFVASRGAGSVVVDVISQGDGSAARIEVRRQGDADAVPMARLDIRVPDRLGAVEFLEIDHSGRMFLFAEDIPVSGGIASAFVARYSPAGGLQGIYELPLSNVPLSRRIRNSLWRRRRLFSSYTEQWCRCPRTWISRRFRKGD